MNGTSPRYLKAIPLILVLLTAFACSSPPSGKDNVSRQADQGNAEAQYVLGGMYYEGKNVPQDYAEAIKWTRMAADRENADAQYVLGVQYQKGRVVPQDYAEAAKWYGRAADQGHAGAQFALGFMYVVGRGVPQDHVQSYFWYSLAASRSAGEDYKKYSEKRDQVALKLPPDHLMKAQQMTREWEAKHPRK